MNIFNIFRKSKREELKQQPPELPPINQQPNIDLSIDLLEMPEYKNKLFFLEMIKGKKLDDMFSGRAGFIPENKSAIKDKTTIPVLKNKPNSVLSILMFIDNTIFISLL